MTIAKAEILSVVNANTSRVETDIDVFLLKVLLDISGRFSFLSASTTGTLTGSTDEIAKPTNAIIIDYVVFDDEQPLTEITFGEYLTGEFEGFAVRGDTIYISPKSSLSRGYTIYYGKKHAESVDTIEFAENLRGAIEAGCTAKLMRKYERFDAADAWELEYEKEIKKVIDSMPVEPTPVKLRMI